MRDDGGSHDVLPQRHEPERFGWAVSGAIIFLVSALAWLVIWQAIKWATA